ncbi:hypothetical protein Tco_0260663 [Tanacetum coccineum]
MYKVPTKPNQTRTQRLSQDIRKTNQRVSFSTGVIPTTSVSRPQLKSNQLEDRVMPNISQGKKQEVEDHRRNFKFSNNKTSVTLVEIILFIVDSGCSKHMTGNLKLLTNFMEKFLGIVKFGNDQITPILGYGDLVQGTITIKRVYYVEGLNHNLFSVGQFCDADLEVAFRKSTCYIRDLKGNDLLTGSRGTDLYSITLQDSTTPNLIYFWLKANIVSSMVMASSSISFICSCFRTTFSNWNCLLSPLIRVWWILETIVDEFTVRFGVNVSLDSGFPLNELVGSLKSQMDALISSCSRFPSSTNLYNISSIVRLLSG